MSRDRQPRIERPIYDLGVVYAPGVPAVDPASDAWPHLLEAADMSRSFRGAIMASGYEIEQFLNDFLVELFAPSFAYAGAREVFEAAFVRKMSLDRKIEVLRECCKGMDWLRVHVEDDLIARLTEFRLLRNDLAHYPVALEVTSHAPVHLRVILSGAERDMEITKEVCTTLHQRAMSLSHTLRYLPYSLKNIPKPL